MKLQDIPKSVIDKLVAEAIEYCNENHKGGDAKYKAAFDCYMQGATSVILNPKKYIKSKQQ